MRRACIDIGSNTTRLLVADCEGYELVECRQERAFTLIGGAIDARGAIPAPKLAEVVNAVVAQYAIARELGAVDVRGVATAAIRRATNGEALTCLIHRACPGLELETLSEAQEARLAFIGAAWGVGAPAGTRLGVVDAGGGSCELVVGEAPADIRWWVSLPIGSGVLTHRWLHSDPPTEAELALARAGTREVFDAIGRPPAVPKAVAVGGSATTLRMLAGPLLDGPTLARLLELRRERRSTEFAGEYGIDVQRSRLLPGGLVVLGEICERFGVPLEVGRGGLREGLLLADPPVSGHQ